MGCESEGTSTSYDTLSTSLRDSVSTVQRRQEMILAGTTHSGCDRKTSRTAQLKLISAQDQLSKVLK